MSFNYEIEKRKFFEQWKHLEQQYQDAGMNETDIKQMREYDWQYFLSRRRYALHNQRFPDEGINMDDPSENSTLLKKFTTMSTTINEEEINRFSWIDTLEDQRLLSGVGKLSTDELEMFTFLAIEGHTLEELAKKKGCTINTIHKKYSRAKKVFKKG